MAEMHTARKKYAFISYSHRDTRHARWLQRRLESYKLPAEIHNEFEDSRYLRPIFRDRADLGAGVLNHELRKHLDSSKFLIVVCSPQAAASEWVNNEIGTFLEWGRDEYIIPFIVGGDITSEGADNPIPPVLRDHYAANPDKELLSVDIREAGATKAYIRVVSRMLDIEFDELWRRHLRERRRNTLLGSTLGLFSLFLIYWFAVPVSLTIELRDANHNNLPMPEEAYIEVAGRKYSIASFDQSVVIDDLPGYYRLRDVELRFAATYYNDIVEPIPLTAGISNSVAIALSRDDSFGTYAGVVLDDNGIPIEGVTVDVEGVTATTNSQGEFHIDIPVENQSPTKRVVISKDGYVTRVREDECPSDRISYLLHNFL